MGHFSFLKFRAVGLVPLIFTRVNSGQEARRLGRCAPAPSARRVGSRERELTQMRGQGGGWRAGAVGGGGRDFMDAFAAPHWLGLQALLSLCVSRGLCLAAVWFGSVAGNVHPRSGLGSLPPQAARPSSVSFTVRRCVEHLQTPCARSWASRLRQNQGPALLAPASHPTRGRGPAREEGDACCPEEAQRENSNVGAGWGWGGLKRRGWRGGCRGPGPGALRPCPSLLPHSACRSWLLQSIRAINNNLCVLTFVWFGKNRN